MCTYVYTILILYVYICIYNSNSICVNSNSICVQAELAEAEWCDAKKNALSVNLARSLSLSVCVCVRACVRAAFVMCVCVYVYVCVCVCVCPKPDTQGRVLFPLTSFYHSEKLSFSEFLLLLYKILTCVSP